jgi:hypothetical protein
MRKFLHRGINMTQNENGDYIIHFDKPLVTITGKTYNSVDEYLKHVHDTVFDTLPTLIKEAQELHDELSKPKTEYPSKFEQHIPANFNAANALGLGNPLFGIYHPSSIFDGIKPLQAGADKIKQGVGAKATNQSSPQKATPKKVKKSKTKGTNADIITTVPLSGDVPYSYKWSNGSAGDPIQASQQNTYAKVNNKPGDTYPSYNKSEEEQTKKQKSDPGQPAAQSGWGKAVSGNKIGNTAIDLETEWKKAGVTYDDTHADQLKVQEDAVISDCVTFVAEAFAKAGYTSIFGTTRDYPQTTDMLKRMYFLTFGEEVPKDKTAKTKKEKGAEAIKEIEKAKKALTMDNPEPGDVMMWSGHVGIITDLDEKAGTFNYVQMGLHGASKSWKGIHYKDEEQMKEDISATSKIASSEFWGFWRPKAP